MAPIGLLARLAALLALVLGAQVAFYAATAGQHLPHPLRHFRTVLAAQPDVLYFGDSVQLFLRDDDTDRRPLPAMLDHALPGLDVAPFAGAGYHPEVYAAYMDYYAASEADVPCVIVPINLRSLCPRWGLKPQFKFGREIWWARHRGLLERAFFKPLSVFGMIDLNPLSVEQFQAVPLYAEGEYLGTIEDVYRAREEDVTEADQPDLIRAGYLCDLPPDHPKLEALSAIARLAEATRTRVIFYLTPLDHERAGRYVGDRFEEGVAERADRLRSRLANEWTVFIDLSMALGSEDFFPLNRPDEHLGQEGRLFVAARLAEEIRALERDGAFAEAK